MRLMFSIALTHVLSRVRQSLVGMLGVATGVGFSVMMAALMEGSQRDFVDQLIDTMPHITVTDERRSPPVQPATTVYDATDKSQIVHVAAEGASLPPVGATVTATLDWETRHRLMRMHTALHLVCGLLKFPVTGGQIGAEEGRLDFDIQEATVRVPCAVAPLLSVTVSVTT